MTYSANPAGVLPRLYGYKRVSKDEMALKGYGLEEQDRIIRAKAAELGGPLIGIEVDDFTGQTLDRPGWNRVRALAEARAFDVLLIPCLDRISRKAHLRRVAEAELEEYGIAVLYCSQYFTPDAEGNLQKGVLSEVAEFELANIRRRTMGGRRAKANGDKEGCVKRMPVGRAAYGWRQVTRAEADLLPEFKGRSGEWLLVEEEAAFVRELFSRILAGQSLRSLAAWADTSGHRPRQGTLWHASAIRYILTNPAYYGEAVYNRQSHQQLSRLNRYRTDLKRRHTTNPEKEWIRIPVPPIVSREVWDGVQERLAANAGGRPAFVNAWPLTPVTRCGTCVGEHGAPLPVRGRADKRGSRRYYRCSSDSKKGCRSCGAVYDADALEGQARNTIRDALAPGVLAKLARDKALAQAKEAGAPEKQIQAIDRQLKALDEETEGLFGQMKRMGFDERFIARKNAEINASRLELEEKRRDLATHRIRLRCPEEAARNADAAAAKLAENLEGKLASPEGFRALALQLLRIRIFQGGREETEVLIPEPPV